MRNVDGPPQRFVDPRRPSDAPGTALCSTAPRDRYRGRVRRRAHAFSSAQKQRATAQGLVDAIGSAAGVAGGLIRPTGRGGGAQTFNEGVGLGVERPCDARGPDRVTRLEPITSRRPQPRPLHVRRVRPDQGCHTIHTPRDAFGAPPPPHTAFAGRTIKGIHGALRFPLHDGVRRVVAPARRGRAAAQARSNARAAPPRDRARPRLRRDRQKRA